eukprot:CAMPEP_0183394316 /NCGR_PEP_ID=MMETSP0370-20130417/8491_1 /TAXON_ID=268820 /ORGANISM="Peridinium aciculiferum, Strain PAER-2" /LENGTH=293 /DNA_ID=CAMNT_0025574677 /DNA_START=85 /DNA_END=966 /DNA_ORIENTATION=-
MFVAVRRSQAICHLEALLGLPQNLAVSQHLLAGLIDDLAVLPEGQNIEGLLHSRADVLDAHHKKGDHHRHGHRADGPHQREERQRQEVAPEKQKSARELGVRRVDRSPQDLLATPQRPLQHHQAPVDLGGGDGMHPAQRGVREDVCVDVPQLVQHPHRAIITGQQALNDVEFPLVFHVPNLMQLCLQGHIHGCPDLRIGHLISDDDVRVAPVLSEVILERHREAPEQLHRLQLRIDHAIVVGPLLTRDARQNSARQSADLVDREAPLGARICVAAVACLRLEGDKQPQGDGGH